LNNKTIILDMDGVLADFVGGVRELFGMPDDWTPKEYEFIEGMGMTPQQFWTRISNRPDFFYNLEPIHDGLYLARRLITEGFDVAVATSPPLDPRAAKDKIQWIGTHLPELSRDFFITPRKELLSMSGRILIDDCDANCEKWRERGGTAFLAKQSYSQSGLTFQQILARILHKENTQAND
jgi:5'(3')-deoxyribonucleotidase